MNRLEMKMHISARILFLAKRDGEEWSQTEALRKQFVADYPVSKIEQLTLAQYVIGKDSNNRSFCYRLERELHSLGRIGCAETYVVYYDRSASDPKMMFRIKPRWGTNKDKVFTAVKQAIVSLLLAAARDDQTAIRVNLIPGMLKGKLLSIYFPDKFAPVCASWQLEHYLAQLNIRGTFESETDMQRALMAYRATWPALKAQPAGLYVSFLYDLFGYPWTAGPFGITSSVIAPLLSDALKGAEVVSKMPPVSGTTAGPAGTQSGSAHYDEKLNRSKRIGARGEAIVLELEKSRLIDADRGDLAAKVKHIADRDNSAGFDILSYDKDGSERPIEVKATSDKTLKKGFYITADELEKASGLKNYHIYFVFSAISSQPRILPVKKPFSKGSAFDLRAVEYHATPKKGKGNK
ncbi:MAG: DUF3883 domain-containing protein [Nitrospirae bacterium]|nr:DUF3883 domain-containing protein [Nitrospirota bacterium]